MGVVGKNTKAHDGVVFLARRARRGDVEYWIWKSGIIPEGPGAYALNEKPRRRRLRSQLRKRGMFCAAVPNIVRRFAGKIVPYRPGLEPGEEEKEWDGSISAYFDGSAFGRGFYHDYERPFDASTAVRWARETNSATLLGMGYDGPAIADQGHTGLVLPDGRILQSAFGEGLHMGRTVFQERRYWSRGGVMVHPRDWIEHNRSVAEWARR